MKINGEIKTTIHYIGRVIINKFCKSSGLELVDIIEWIPSWETGCTKDTIQTRAIFLPKTVVSSVHLKLV